MPRNNLIRNALRLYSPPVPSPSAELEQNALREFDERDRPAVEAIFHARRHECWLTFSVEPAISDSYGLSRRAMTSAMDRLEGRLIETVRKERGTPREIRLLPEWENPEALAGDVGQKFREAFADDLTAQEGSRMRAEVERYIFPDLTHPPEILEKLRQALDPPSDP